MKGPRSDNALHPSNWGQTTAIAALWFIARLPWRWAIGLGEALGIALYHVAKSRRYVVRRNLEMCFPELSESQREKWVRANFRYTGRGVAEVALGWFGGKAVDRIPCRIDGLHHLRAAAEEGIPVILLSGHFSCIELAGRLFGQHAEMAVIYKPMEKKPVLERAMKQGRENSLSRAISKDDIRGILRTLKSGVPVWYAGDQNIRRAEQVFVPLFGMTAATTTGLPRLAQMGRARVLPLFYHVNSEGDGYEIEIGPPIEAYPSDDRTRDAARMNEVLEEAIRANPQQYFWAHRRFKTQPEGSPDPYPAIRSKHIGRLPWQKNKRKTKKKRKASGDGS
ncbi:lysophospholipid acyltransferase family protein [Thioalkalivibrio sp. ALJ15]|uniref:LpxL/LpxP family acyltransferase n=1 Tax=Thioalkalivibrio sp. ALJ15 TaxID=748652 RepID=UPI00037A6BF8|nr:lysophospholipid acyltransferase family protein [Thioalkalivibrio sp. ALJ15]